jgi:branched-chain amino acid transport system substrate-binding protein
MKASTYWLFKSVAIAMLIATPAAAQKKYDVGASDSEIKIGNMAPYSGPLSAYSVAAKTEAAYFNKINTEGGIRGRKIKFISYDDAYNPAKGVEQGRKLVESDEVLLIFQSLGVGAYAIRKYLNDRKIPQLFVAGGISAFGDPKNFPWTIGFQPTFVTEGHIFAKYLLEHHSDGKIGILYQDTDLGRDYVKGFKAGLDGKMQIVAEQVYQAADPTIDSQITSLQLSGADIFFDQTTPKFAVQAIRKAAALNWKPIHLLNSISASIGAVFKPAGLENSNDILSAGYLKDVTDPLWRADPAVDEWSAFIDQYLPGTDKSDVFRVYGYVVAQALVQVLKQCSDNLTRENVMKETLNLKSLQLGMLLPGITINTGPSDYFPIKQMQMLWFNGEHEEYFGPIMGAQGM